MRIGIVGGTFDPFHRGHLDPILSIRKEMEWERLLYIPAATQPFKLQQRSASSYHRFTMTVLATERHESIHVLPLELERAGVSYTVDSLEEIRGKHPEDTLDWVIGEDNLDSLDQWHRLDRILELANFAVLTRTAEAASAAAPEGLADRAGRYGVAVTTTPSLRPRSGTITLTPNLKVYASSTEIRRRLQAGEPVDHLVDARVLHYIHHNQLYREAPL